MQECHEEVYPEYRFYEKIKSFNHIVSFGGFVDVKREKKDIPNAVDSYEN